MPIHPMVVHFPVALLLFSVFLDALGAARRDEKLHRAASYSLMAGVAGAILAVGTGLFQAYKMEERFAQMRDTVGAAGGFPGGEEMRAQMLQTVAVHRALGLAVLAVFLGLLLWRFSQKGAGHGRAPGAYLLVAVLGVSILSTASFYGGKLGHGRREGQQRGRQEFRMDRQTGTDLPLNGDRAPAMNGGPGAGGGRGMPSGAGQ